MEGLDFKLTETTIERSFDPQELDAHFLEAGEIAEVIDDRAKWGVVVKSALNDATTVQFKVGDEPVRAFSRRRLRWLGPLD